MLFKQYSFYSYSLTLFTFVQCDLCVCVCVRACVRACVRVCVCRGGVGVGLGLG